MNESSISSVANSHLPKILDSSRYNIVKEFHHNSTYRRASISEIKVYVGPFAFRKHRRLHFPSVDGPRRRAERSPLAGLRVAASHESARGVKFRCGRTARARVVVAAAAAIMITVRRGPPGRRGAEPRRRPAGRAAASLELSARDQIAPAYQLSALDHSQVIGDQTFYFSLSVSRRRSL